MRPVHRALELLGSAARNPGHVPAYVLKRIHPARYSPWTRENDVVTWNTAAGYGWGEGNTPPEVAAVNYHIVEGLRSDLAGRRYGHAVEVGCGYGRVTPWLGEFADELTGIDPNAEVLGLVDRLYPEAGINTVRGVVQSLPLADGSADLVVTRAVLQHVPPDDIAKAAAELTRVASDDAHLLISEATDGGETGAFHPRTVETYSELLDGFTLMDNARTTTHASTREYTRRRLFFERD